MRKAILATVLLLVAAASAGQATGAEPKATSLFASRFADVQLPQRYFDLSHFILEFAPGAVFPLQSTATAVDTYFTVYEGELDITIGGETKAYGVGKSGVIPSGLYRAFSNAGRSVRAKMFVSVITPTGVAPVFTLAAGVEPPALTPTQSNVAKLSGLYTTADKVTIVQSMADWDPGFKTPLHVMNHIHVLSGLDGENTARYTDGGVEVLKAGQQGVMHVGRPGTMENAGTTNSRWAVTWVLTSSVPPSSLVPAPAPALGAPSTGDAGLAAAPDAASPSWGLAAAVGAAAGAALALGPRRRRIMTRR